MQRWRVARRPQIRLREYVYGGQVWNKLTGNLEKCQ